MTTLAASNPHAGSAGAAQVSSAAGTANPYLGHRHLTEDQQILLGEYARLANTIQSISTRATALSATNTHSALLSELRILERKMGLVLTLFKASVWSVVTADTDAMAEEEDGEHPQQIMDPDQQGNVDSLAYDHADPNGQYYDHRDGYAYDDDGQHAY